MVRRSTREPTDHHDWEARRSDGWFFTYVLGVAVPIVVSGYGLVAMFRQQATFGNRVTWTFTGVNAIALGIAAISAAVIIHCHFFWGSRYGDSGYVDLGKIVGLIGFIAGTGFVLVRNGVLGLQ